MEPLNHEKEFVARAQFLDRCLEASESLRTIDPHDKETDENSLERARKWVSEAKVVYILGFMMPVVWQGTGRPRYIGLGN